MINDGPFVNAALDRVAARQYLKDLEPKFTHIGQNDRAVKKEFHCPDCNNRMSQWVRFDEWWQGRLGLPKKDELQPGAPQAPCTCGSARKFKNCCGGKPCHCGSAQKFGRCCGKVSA